MPRHIIGLDLGQVADPSALVVVEHDAPRFDVCEIRRWPLGTPYPVIVADVRSLYIRPQLESPALVADATGVGRPVIDMLVAAGCYPQGVMITSGNQATRDEYGYWHVPKRELVSTVQVLLQSGTLKIARGLAEAQTLAQELLSFEARITTAANDTYGTWREGKHDDIVLALALACWYAPCCLSPADLYAFVG